MAIFPGSVNTLRDRLSLATKIPLSLVKPLMFLDQLSCLLALISRPFQLEILEFPELEALASWVHYSFREVSDRGHKAKGLKEQVTIRRYRTRIRPSCSLSCWNLRNCVGVNQQEIPSIVPRSQMQELAWSFKTTTFWSYHMILQNKASWPSASTASL